MAKTQMKRTAESAQGRTEEELRRNEAKRWDEELRRNGSKRLNEEKIARGLGWFSIGLGVAEIVAPRSLAKLIGVRGDHSGLFRMLGAREITSGVGILAGRRPNANWLWSRVGGDAIDLALLGAAFNANKGWFNRKRRVRTLAAIGAVAPVVAADIICARRLTRQATEEAARS